MDDDLPDFGDLTDDAEPVNDPMNTTKRGGAVSLVAGVLGAIAVFLFAPALPLGAWAVYVRALVALLAGALVFGIGWFLTVLTAMKGVF